MLNNYFNPALSRNCFLFSASRGYAPIIVIGEEVLKEILKDPFFDDSEKDFKENDLILKWNGIEVIYREDAEFMYLT